jgi:glc operon protein GlcG
MYQAMQLSHSDALKVIEVIRAEVDKESKGAAIAVVDEHGELLAFLRTDGCRLSSINIAINKAYTAAREQKTSRSLGQSSRTDNFALTNFGELRYTGWGGGVPIVHDGKVIGGVGVSGLPEEEDMVLAQLGIEALQKS